MLSRDHETDISDAEFLSKLPSDPRQASRIFVSQYGNEKRMYINNAKRYVYIYSFIPGKDGGILNLQTVTFGQLGRARELFKNDGEGLLKHLSQISRNHFTAYGTPEFLQDIQDFLSLPMQIRGEEKDIIKALYDIDTGLGISGSITTADKKEKQEEVKPPAQIGYAERQKLLYTKVEDIVKGFRESPDSIAEYLLFARRFNRYSHKNLRIIFAQDRNASFVESASFFKKGMPDSNGKPLTDKKIFIKKGERALYIWAPREVRYVMHPKFNKYIAERYLSEDDRAKASAEAWKSSVRTEFLLVPVFDISQTDAPPEVYPKIFNFVGEKTPECTAAYRAICEYLEKELNCSVEICDIGSMKTSVRGYYSPDENAIKLSDMLSGNELLSTAIHEAAHAELHSVRTDRSTCQKELEADMYALMLQEKMGIEITDSRKSHLSEHYNAYIQELQEKLKSGEVLDISADCPAFNNAIQRYQKQSPVIDKYLSKHLNQAATVNKAAEAQESPRQARHSSYTQKRTL